jgi:hypothetical protein
MYNYVLGRLLLLLLLLTVWLLGGESKHKCRHALHIMNDVSSDQMPCSRAGHKRATCPCDNGA